MAQIARTAIAKAATLVHEMADQAGDVMRPSAVKLALVQPAATETTKLGRTFVDLANEQTRHNLETLQALAGTVAWERVLEVQGAFLHASLERMTRLMQHQLQLSSAIMGPMAATMRRRTDQAA